MNIQHYRHEFLHVIMNRAYLPQIPQFSPCQVINIFKIKVHLQLLPSVYVTPSLLDLVMSYASPDLGHNYEEHCCPIYLQLLQVYTQSQEVPVHIKQKILKLLGVLLFGIWFRV